MEQRDSSRSGKHLTREERMVIERMSRGPPPRDIAAGLAPTGSAPTRSDRGPDRPRQGQTVNRGPDGVADGVRP